MSLHVLLRGLPPDAAGELREVSEQARVHPSGTRRGALLRLGQESLSADRAQPRQTGGSYCGILSYSVLSYLPYPIPSYPIPPLSYPFVSIYSTLSHCFHIFALLLYPDLPISPFLSCSGQSYRNYIYRTTSSSFSHRQVGDFVVLVGKLSITLTCSAAAYIYLTRVRGEASGQGGVILPVVLVCFVAFYTATMFLGVLSATADAMLQVPTPLSLLHPPPSPCPAHHYLQW